MKLVAGGNRVMSVILIALCIMWLAPFGTFDPSRFEFYACVFTGILIGVVTFFLIKRFQNRIPRYMMLVAFLNRAMSVTLMALVFMWLMPHGTFDPSRFGFYTSIFTAIFIERVTFYMIKKSQSDPENFRVPD